MKNNFITIALASIAIVGCSPDYVWDNLPVVPEPEPVITYEGEGNLIYMGSNAETPHTYSWKADGNTIRIDVNVDSEYYLNGDEDAKVDGGGWQIGAFQLSKLSVGDFLGGILVSDDLNEDNFYPVDPDGTFPGDMTSYKPGMWVDVEGAACGWGDGRFFWQWYVWGGKEDKGGNVIGYDFDYLTYPDYLYLGTNPGNFKDAMGKTIESKMKIALGDMEYDFIVSLKFSTAEIIEPESEGFQEAYIKTLNGDIIYSQGVYGPHAYSWELGRDGVNVEVWAYAPSIASNGEWAYLFTVINPDELVSYLGIEDIETLNSLEYFYPLEADSSAYLKDGAKAWTSYAPGQWYDENGNGSGSNGALFFQYQFGEHMYEGHFTEGLLVIGTNPANIAALAGKTVVGKAMICDKPFTVTMHVLGEYPTSGEGSIGRNRYSWALEDSGITINAECSLSDGAENTWHCFGFALNHEWINAKYGIKIEEDAQDIEKFYPLDPDGNSYGKWSSYEPGQWFGADGYNGTEESPTIGFWQYYAYKTYDYDIADFMFFGKSPERATEGFEATSRAKLNDLDWTVNYKIVQ